MNDRRTTEWALVLGIAAFILCAIWTKRNTDTQNAAPVVVEEVPTVLYDTIISYRKVPPFTISAYDRIFRQYADSLQWDWKWLAAVAYTESRFHPEAANPSGATGLMQIMPSTAAAMGVDSLALVNPHENVKAAARLFKRLDKIFASSAMPDRACMVLAAYNAGAGHVRDAALLTEQHGGNRKQWYGNVEYFVRSSETTHFVRKVFEKYSEYCRLEHLYQAVNHPDTLLVPKTPQEDEQ